MDDTGRYKKKLGGVEKACELFETGMPLDPQRSDWYYPSGELCEKHSRYKATIKMYERDAHTMETDNWDYEKFQEMKNLTERVKNNPMHLMYIVPPEPTKLDFRTRQHMEKLLFNASWSPNVSDLKFFLLCVLPYYWRKYYS
ncbi:hypothetical protein BDA99DRAFT_561142 [Phascolomyces articulosus]|uniref:Uncharacterized protein n=1 Tax=Phascolomyces articulosus TaxID=60185 RepID=A0AAD5JX77_9FUNG|nr:hypothetical protein BDA99DRAFT_561142 [Phascolomyces articulosus]